MNKLYVVLLVCTLSIVLCTPAFALFTNGGFEDGTLNGWTVETGTRGTGTALYWSPGYHSLYSAIDNTATMPGQSIDINPYNGNYMARINDIYGGNDATRLSQVDTLTQADIDSNPTLYVNWGAALIEPSNLHDVSAQPYFSINVTRNGSQLNYFTADASTQQGGGWVNAGDYGGTLWYKAATWSFNLGAITGIAAGDQIGIELMVADCDWGGHGAYAFLDGIGTVNPGNPNDPNDQGDTGNPVPEPMTMLLFGPALLGLVGLKKKK